MRVKCLTSEDYAFNEASQSFVGIPEKTYTLSADLLLPNDVNKGGAWIGFLYEKANNETDKSSGKRIYRHST